MFNITQRDAFFNQLYFMAKEDKDIILVVADMSAPSLDIFRKNLPNQFINVGIAEQNAILISSGLSLIGKKVFVYAISPFITLRCLEQIRVSNAMMGIPITIIGMGTGLSYFTDGPTHHLIEDISVLRSFPNIKINTLTDSIMASQYPKLCLDSNITNYIRIDKDFTPDIYTVSSDFSKGILRVREGEENIIISTGPMVHIVNDIVKSTKKNIGIIDIFQIPINEKLLIDIIKNVKKIITVEEHFLPGGLGSAICEIINDNKININIKRLGLNIDYGYKYCYKYGGRDIIRSYHGIDKNTLRNVITEYFNL